MVDETKTLSGDNKIEPNDVENALHHIQNHINFDRFVMYLKVFLGMGFLWTMEIVAGLASDEIHESFW